jgi:hypothetical protein
VLYSPRGGDGPPPLSYPVGLVRNFRALLKPVEHDAKVRELVISMASRLLEIAQSNECTTMEINPPNGGRLLHGLPGYQTFRLAGGRGGRQRLCRHARPGEASACSRRTAN